MIIHSCTWHIVLTRYICIPNIIKITQGDKCYWVHKLLVEQIWSKIDRLPLPISKRENDCKNDMTRCWSFLDRRNYFFKGGGSGVKIGKNFIFRSKMANFCNPFAAPAKKDWKMIIESYIIPLLFYYDVKTGIVMPWFFGENQCFY